MLKKFSVFNKGFTLVELLIVVGILALLAVFLLLVINPVEFIAQSRDAKRLNDIKILSETIVFAELYGEDIDIYEGKDIFKNIEAHRVYTSLPDMDGDKKCDEYSLPDLGDEVWEYRCFASSSSMGNIDGTGWLPIDLSTVPQGKRALYTLPVDPSNNGSTGNYLLFGYSIAPESFSIAVKVDSNKYLDGLAVSDGGNSPTLYETRPVPWIEPLANITVNKVVINDDLGNASVQDFPLFVDDVYSGYRTQVTSGVPIQIPAGYYRVGETGMIGYEGHISVDCDINYRIILSPGDNKACTITNDDISGYLTLNTLPEGVYVLLRIDGEPLGCNGCTNLVEADVPHTINEEVPSGYHFVSIIGVGCPAELGGTVTVSEGESIMCTFVNELD